MPLARRSTFAFLAVLALANLAIRYPSAPHELGVDSFVWHGMATSLRSNENALWIISPLSYFGLYPLSHPSGSPFIAAAFSDLSGLSIEGSLVLLDMAISISALLQAFMLAREFIRKNTFALLLAGVFSLTPIMVSSLTWQMPTRIMFTALLPTFLWALIRLSRQRVFQYWVILGTCFLLMASFHRLTVLVALVALSYVFTGIFLVVVRTLRLRFPSVFLGASYRRLAPSAALAAIGFVASGTLLLTNALDEYSVGVIASGSSLNIELLNLGVSLARSSGPLLPAAFLGVAVVAMRQNKEFKEPFIMIVLLTFVPILLLRQYTGYYTVPFTSLFIAFGVFSAGRRLRSHRGRITAASVLAVFVVASSAVISTYDLGVTSYMSDQTYSSALYVKFQTEGSLIANDGLVGSRVHAISGRPYLPVGGATTPFQSPDLLMFFFFDPEEVSRNISQVPILRLTINSDSLYELQTVQAEADWANILLTDVDSIPANYDRYHLSYAIESRTLQGRYTAYGNVYTSIFLQSVSSVRYATYQDSSVTVWYLGG